VIFECIAASDLVFKHEFRHSHEYPFRCVYHLSVIELFVLIVLLFLFRVLFLILIVIVILVLVLLFIYLLFHLRGSGLIPNFILVLRIVFVFFL